MQTTYTKASHIASNSIPSGFFLFYFYFFFWRMTFFIERNHFTLTAFISYIFGRYLIWLFERTEKMRYEIGYASICNSRWNQIKRAAIQFNSLSTYNIFEISKFKLQKTTNRSLKNIVNLFMDLQIRTNPKFHISFNRYYLDVSTVCWLMK